MQADAKTPSEIEQLAIAARRKIERQIGKQRRLIANLKGDLEKHGDPERWRRYGDLLLANAANATRQGDRIIVRDYFVDAAPEIEIEGDANKTVTEVAEGYFRQYTKARNGMKIIAERLGAAEDAITKAEATLEKIR